MSFFIVKHPNCKDSPQLINTVFQKHSGPVSILVYFEKRKPVVVTNLRKLKDVMGVYEEFKASCPVDPETNEKKRPGFIMHFSDDESCLFPMEVSDGVFYGHESRDNVSIVEGMKPWEAMLDSLKDLGSEKVTSPSFRNLFETGHKRDIVIWLDTNRTNIPFIFGSFLGTWGDLHWCSKPGILPTAPVFKPTPSPVADRKGPYVAPTTPATPAKPVTPAPPPLPQPRATVYMGETHCVCGEPLLSVNEMMTEQCEQCYSTSPEQKQPDALIDL